MDQEENCGCGGHGHHHEEQNMESQERPGENCGCGGHGHHGHHETRDQHNGGCNCPCHQQHHGGMGFHRRFISQEEIVNQLEEYLKQLQAEAKGVEEKLAELRKQKESQ
jgi:hypothetical protein